MTLDDQEWKEHIAMLKASKLAAQGTLAAVTCSATRCANGHVFMYAGQPPEGRTPEGWLCECGQTKAHWKQCGECGQEILEAVPLNG